MYKQATKFTVNLTPYLFLIGVMFVMLKITGLVSWSWFWVLSPFWAPFAVWFSGVLLVMAIIVFVGLLMVFGLIPRKDNSPWT